MDRHKTAQFRAHMHQHHQTKGNTMATFEFEIIDYSVIDGVRREKKKSAYVFNYPTDIGRFAEFVAAAKAQKGKKNKNDEWVFVGFPKLRNKLEAEKIRDDVYELNKVAEGKPTLRSRIRDYTEDGKTYWLLSVRYLTDSEQETRDKGRNKETNVSKSDLQAALDKINK